VETLEGPDEWSRTKDHEGRRIAPADGGWVLLNHAKFRAMQSADDRRERSRVAMAEMRRNRKQQKAIVNGCEHELTKLPQAEAEAEAKNIVPTALVDKVDPYRPPDCPFSELKAAYHELCPSLRKIVVDTTMRQKHCHARWVQVSVAEKWGRDQTLEWFRWFFAEVEKSDFLTGRRGNADRPWKADFQWLMTAGNFAKVIEGKYEREKA
jgi:hypothetical protein